jgi:Right handed beta helix region
MIETFNLRYLLMFVIVISSLMTFGLKPVYVSPMGSDSGDGSLSNPLSTIQKARDLIRSKKLSGEQGPFSILLGKGDYYFDHTLSFDNQDRGLSISPLNEEKVRFTGGISINPSQALPVAGSAKGEKFPVDARSHILMVNLKRLGITDYGNLTQFGFGHSLSASAMELFINGKGSHLSRWPNDSIVPVVNVLDKGSVAAEGDKGTRGGRFTYSGNHPSSWKNQEGIWIFGYFNYGWADDAIQLASIDTIEKVLATVQPHNYGFSSGKKWNGWYAYNIPEELDEPGEYYIDRTEGILYFYNPGKMEHLEVSVLKDPFITMNETSDITVNGIEFESARGAGIEIKSSSNCILKKCSFRNLGLYAVNISDNKDGAVGTKNGLVDCSISQTGAGGVQLFGGDRRTLTAAGNFVENCSIHDFNRIVKTYCAGVQISGVANRISHCEIFDSPHVAILLSGNDHLIEYNDIHHVCQSTDDVGALYYGRNPSERGIQVRTNYFHEIGLNHYNTSAIYHDDGACGMSVFGNILYKAGSMPSLIGGGSDNSYINNIFIDCPIGIHIDDRLLNWARDMVAKGDVFDKDLTDINYSKPPYSIRYPELAGYWEENPDVPKRNLIDKNVFVRVDNLIQGDIKYLDYSDHNLITKKDPGFLNEKGHNFKLKKSSKIFRKVPGFKPIPFDKIGIQKK